MPARTSYDHVCVSAYNWGDDKSGGYKAFEEVFTFAYKNMAEATDAPLGLCEGSTVGPGGDKGDWYKAALETLMKLPRVTQAHWFLINVNVSSTAAMKHQCCIYLKQASVLLHTISRSTVSQSYGSVC
jgi:hypothetical protein